MTVRGISPGSDNPGKGLGLSNLRWSYVWSLLYNGLTLTAQAVGFTISGGTTSKSLTINKTLTLDGTDGTTMTFPATSASIARTDAAQSFTGVQTFVAPILGTPTSGALDNCTSNTEADNNATTQLATTAFAKSQDAVLARLPNQAVNMTAAASGSSGISVADNDNIDFGTGNFTLVWRGSLPDWTPGVSKYLFTKSGSGTYVQAYVGYTNKFGMYLAGAGGEIKDVTSTDTVPLVDGTIHEITYSVIRETVSVAGSVSIYLNGVLFYTTSITAGAGGSVSNTGILYILGTGGERHAGTCSFAATYNRALTAAEVLDLYRNGIAFGDKWGSQTNIFTGNDGTFAGASNWVNGSWNSFNSTTDLSLTATAGGQFCRLPVANLPVTGGKSYRLSFDAANIVGTFNFLDFGLSTYMQPSSVAITPVSGRNSFEFITALNVSGGLGIYAISANASADFDNFSLVEIGATLALEPEGIQNNLWYDSSSNALNASYPATGWSLARKLNAPRTNTGQPAFLYYLVSSISTATGDGTPYTVLFDTKILDTDLSYNVSTGKFTAKVAGIYTFDCNLSFGGMGAGHNSHIIDLVTTQKTYRWDDEFPAGANPFVSFRTMNLSKKAIPMSANDTAYIVATVSGSTKTVLVYGSNTYMYATFSGRLAC